MKGFNLLLNSMRCVASVGRIEDVEAGKIGMNASPSSWCFAPLQAAFEGASCATFPDVFRSTIYCEPSAVKEENILGNNVGSGTTQKTRTRMAMRDVQAEL